MTADDLDALYRAVVDAENDAAEAEMAARDSFALANSIDASDESDSAFAFDDAYLDDENYGIALDRLYASRDAYAAAVAASLYD